MVREWGREIRVPGLMDSGSVGDLRAEIRVVAPRAAHRPTPLPTGPVPRSRLLFGFLKGGFRRSRAGAYEALISRSGDNGQGKTNLIETAFVVGGAAFVSRARLTTSIGQRHCDPGHVHARGRAASTSSSVYVEQRLRRAASTLYTFARCSSRIERAENDRDSRGLVARALIETRHCGAKR